MHPYIENNKQPIYLSYHRKSYDFPTHFHQNIELAYCFSGAQTIVVGEEIFSLKSGDVCLIFPNTIHGYQTAPGSPEGENLSVMCNVSLLTTLFPDLLSKQPVTPYLSAKELPPDMASLFRQLLTAENHMELLGYTYLILSRIFKKIELISSRSDPELPAKITTYIDSHFQEPLTIEVLAKIFGYHPSYITHLFCDRLKIPFRTYLTSVRCDYAAKQMHTPEKSLTEIAFDSGFGSLNTFCRCFKKHFSMTPSQYKKTIK